MDHELYQHYQHLRSFQEQPTLREKFDRSLISIEDEYVKPLIEPFSQFFLSLIITPFFSEFLIFLLTFSYLLACCFSNVKWWDKTIIFRLFFWIELIFFLLWVLILYLLKTEIFLNAGFFFGYALINNFSTIFIKSILLFLTFVCLLSWFSFVFINRNFWKSINEFVIIFLLNIFFLVILISLNDFFLVLYIIIAISLGLYGLILINIPIYANIPEAGAKYFLLSITSVGIMFGGIKELYLNIGHLNFSIIKPAIIETILNCSNYNDLFVVKYTLFFIAIGFFFKLAAAPNHFWAAEIYSSLPYELLLFFVIPVKLVFSLIFFKIVKTIFFILAINDNLNYILYNEFEILLSIVIILSMLIGSINSIFEQNIRKFLAYSSINQVGFLLIGLLGYDSNCFGFESFLFFVLFYFINLFSFIFILSTDSQTFYIPFGVLKELLNPYKTTSFDIPILAEYYLNACRNIYIIKINFIKDFAKKKNLLQFEIDFFKSNTLEIIIVIILILSLAGIPPFPGFYTKVYILIYSLQISHWIIFWIGILTSILSVFYYLRLLKVMFFEKSNFLMPFIETKFIKEIYEILFSQWLIKIFEFFLVNYKQIPTNSKNKTLIFQLKNLIGNLNIQSFQNLNLNNSLLITQFNWGLLNEKKNWIFNYIKTTKIFFRLKNIQYFFTFELIQILSWLLSHNNPYKINKLKKKLR